MESRVADSVSEGNGPHEFFMGSGSAGPHNLFVLLQVSEVTFFTVCSVESHHIDELLLCLIPHC